MDFAKKQLEKYGWSEGKGLGKHEDGISEAIKPKLKFDNSGVGHKQGEEFTNDWWQKLYNRAAENIDVVVDKGKTKLKVKGESVEITSKNYSEAKLQKNKSLKYGNFLKTAKLTEGGIEHFDVEDYSKPELSNKYEALTDEQLFKACGGRTAHKGARHGLKLTGKLARLEKQEEILLRKLKKVSLTDDTSNTEKKLKKIKKKKEEAQIDEPQDCFEPSTSGVPGFKKKKHKKRKSVSFNETVTKIYTSEQDTSFDSEVDALRDQSNANNEQANVDAANGSDEGIELDIENNNNDRTDDHLSFEQAQINYSDLSRAERKKLKKIRDRRTQSLELEFLECDRSDDVNGKKRKFDPEDTDSLDSRRSEEVVLNKHKCKKNKKKKKKSQKDMEKHQLSSITKSLGKVCRISDDE